MNKISDGKHQTLVKIFIKSAALAAFVYSPISFAQTANPTATPAASPAAGAGNIYVGAPPPDPCRTSLDNITSAENKIAEACRKAGLGAKSNCVAKAKSCGETSGESSFDTMGAIAAALGVQGTSQAAVSNACPQLSGRDYFTEKDKINQEIKDIEKELTELEREKADLKKDYDKEIADINEALSKAQEDYKNKELDIDQKERERVAEFNKLQSDIAEELRQVGSRLGDAETRLIAAQREKAQKLIVLSETASKRACMKEVEKVRQEYTSLGSSSSSNHISKAKDKKAQLIRTFNDCMSQFDQQRIALNEQTQQEITKINREMANLKSRQDEIQNSLNLADSQLQEMKQASVKEKSNALQAVVDLGTRSQEKIKAAYENLVANQTAIDKKIQSLTAALNRANNSIVALGAVPKSRGSDYSTSDAAGEIESQIGVLERISRDSSCGTSTGSAAKEAEKALKGLR